MEILEIKIKCDLLDTISRDWCGLHTFRNMTGRLDCAVSQQLLWFWVATNCKKIQGRMPYYTFSSHEGSVASIKAGRARGISEARFVGPFVKREGYGPRRLQLLSCCRTCLRLETRSFLIHFGIKLKTNNFGGIFRVQENSLRVKCCKEKLLINKSPLVDKNLWL